MTRGPGALPPSCFDDERRARAVWSRLVEPGDPAAARLVAELGAIDALRVAMDGMDGFGAARARAAHTDVEAMLRFATRRGMRIIVPGDPEWPSGVDDLAEPPLCLWVIGGDLTQLRENGVSVVGARAATAYGIGVANEIGAGLAERTWTVVSGGAYGIDAAAHSGALAVGGDTVAVMAGGLDAFYPKGNTVLLERIARTGAVVAEVPPGSAPNRYRFLQRNRLIATLTRGTVVVEAGLRSGSLSTARLADQHLRPVGAVPGPVTSALSAGCHVAIRDGRATLVTDVREVLDVVGRLGVDAATRPSAPPHPLDDLDELDRRVLGGLPPGVITSTERVARNAGVDLREALTALGRLGACGLVERDDGRWRRIRSA